MGSGRSVTWDSEGLGKGKAGGGPPALFDSWLYFVDILNGALIIRQLELPDLHNQMYNLHQYFCCGDKV
ncbi:hypothetical protein CHELA40_14820 [Chelatococcus asaccharovorans]|nr:hypothetical protein CHELA17_60802 [Chelatococcus asaccharovorans]CAH1680167.1 hypothetical protein CHELA40_14820 [Chelatococcus asaccharovorans]